MSDSIRPCPLCAGISSESSFPYAIAFDGKRFGYYRCAACNSVFVDPISACFESAEIEVKVFDEIFS